MYEPRPRTSPAADARCERIVRRSGARGFTLLEILLVLAVLAIGAALTLPALVRPSGTELRTAAGSVVAGLRRAREAAVSTQQPAALTLDLDARRFSVSGETGQRPLPQRVALSLFTARSELDSGQRGHIRFFPDGSSTGGRVTLISGAREIHVDVDWFTGQVRVYTGPPPQIPEPAHGHVRAGT